MCIVPLYMPMGAKTIICCLQVNADELLMRPARVATISKEPRCLGSHHCHRLGCQLNAWGLKGCNALQTYEGGLGGEPGNEAHGGYTFCGLAALMLVGQASVLDLPSLLRWAVHRQVSSYDLRLISVWLTLQS